MKCLDSVGDISSLEACDFNPLCECLNGLLAFLIRIAINGFLAIAHAKEWGLQNVEVALMDQLIEKLEKVGDHQVANMQAIHIGIGGQDDFLIAKVVDRILNAK